MLCIKLYQYIPCEIYGLQSGTGTNSIANTTFCFSFHRISIIINYAHFIRLPLRVDYTKILAWFVCDRASSM
jgi:hypothetical protein